MTSQIREPLLSELYEAMLDCTFGREEPDEMAMSEPVYESVKARIHGLEQQLDWPELRFGGARVFVDPSLPPGVLEIRNTKRPEDPKFNKRLNFTEEPDS